MRIHTVSGLLDLHPGGDLGLGADSSAEQDLGDGSIDKNIEVPLVVVLPSVKVTGGAVVASSTLESTTIESKRKDLVEEIIDVRQCSLWPRRHRAGFQS